MSMTKCSECKREVSTRAKKCPHCGAPVASLHNTLPGLIAVVIAAIVVIWIFYGGGDGDAANKSSRSTTTPVQQMDALDQAVETFVGNYKRAQIKEGLDIAIQKYEYGYLSADNYSTICHMLTLCRKQNGIPEMEILDHVIESHVEGEKLGLYTQISVSEMALAAERR